MRTITSVCFSVALALSAVGVFAKPSQAQATSDQRGACRTFVQDFYTWYTKETAQVAVHKNGKTPYDLVMTTRKELLDPTLYAALKEDSEAQQKNPDDIVGLDSDPFTGSQDIENAYVAGACLPQGDLYRTPLYGFRAGKKSSTPALYAESRLAGDKWQFVNFYFSSCTLHSRAGSPPENTSVSAAAIPDFCPGSQYLSTRLHFS